MESCPIETLWTLVIHKTMVGDGLENMFTTQMAMDQEENLTEQKDQP